jgi:hypothetical protein
MSCRQRVPNVSRNVSAPVPVVTLIAGFGAAHYRFAAVDGDGKPSSAERAYLALFEALHWVHTLDDRLRRDWPGERDEHDRWHSAFASGPTIVGLRYARNRVHHQWADAIAGMSIGSFTGLRAAAIPDPPFMLPAPRQVSDPVGRRGAWRWVATLPPGDRADPVGEEAYRERLAGRLVRETFDELAILFTSVADAFKDPHT